MGDGKEGVVVCWWLKVVRLLRSDVGCRCSFGSSGGTQTDGTIIVDKKKLEAYL